MDVADAALVEELREDRGEEAEVAGEGIAKLGGEGIQQLGGNLLEELRPRGEKQEERELD